MKTPDTAVRRMTAGAVLVVAAIAAVVSYVHIYHLTVTHGQPEPVAMLMPLSVDGTVATASSAMFWAARSGLSAPWLARVMLGLGVAATLGANAAYGAAYGVTGELLSGWPGIAFVGSVEIALSMVRRTRKRAPVVSKAVPETVPATVPDTATDEHAPVTRNVADRYKDDVRAGTLPSVRQIKADMHVGTPRAQRILAQLTALAEA
jgi:Protein of unknown function (DUF2637)